MKPIAALRTLTEHVLETPQSRRKALITGLVVVAVWVTFFDTHSLIRRARWHREHKALTAENARLQLEADSLSAAIEAGLSDEVVERIARETYGMRRPGETVYRIKEVD
jgi:cell division protein FtsB